MDKKQSLDDTLTLMRDLRKRCEWDAAQTHESLRPYLIEEANELDDAIINYVKKEYALALGERTAEEIKIALGSAYPLEEELYAEIRGRDLVSGLPKTIQVSAEEVRKAIEEPVNQIIDAVKNTLDRTPPELAADIMDKGIVLTGGGALLRGLDERLKHETGMPVHIADNPLSSVAIGSGKCLEEFEVLQRVLVSPSRR